jgi:hypothetical protein
VSSDLGKVIRRCVLPGDQIGLLRPYNSGNEPRESRALCLPRGTPPHAPLLGPGVRVYDSLSKPSFLSTGGGNEVGFIRKSSAHPQRLIAGMCEDTHQLVSRFHATSDRPGELRGATLVSALRAWRKSQARGLQPQNLYAPALVPRTLCQMFIVRAMEVRSNRRCRIQC